MLQTEQENALNEQNTVIELQNVNVDAVVKENIELRIDDEIYALMETDRIEGTDNNNFLENIVTQEINAINTENELLELNDVVNMEEIVVEDIEIKTTEQYDETDVENTMEIGTVKERSTDENEPIRKRNIKKKRNPVNRKEKAMLKIVQKHPIQEPCGDKCQKRCNQLFNENQRNCIHKKYWSLSWLDQRKFILNTCSRVPVKRRTLGENSQRNMTFQYRLTGESGKQIDVCKKFFLTTLGYKEKNDKVVFNVLHKTKAGAIAPDQDGRGRNPPTNKIDRQTILRHVDSFHPNISHYRREHAPRVRYLPSDVTITFMHNDFVSKHPECKCSYEAYRKILFDENIRFTKLGHEECEACEKMKLHNGNHTKDNLDQTCVTCNTWSKHMKRAKEARELYQKHANAEFDSKTICISADLEKIIMLPRMEVFKKVLFTHRLTTYNETFVPVGTKQKHVLPVAVLWHEAIRGRGKEELISTFFSFFLQYRDTQHFIVWLDNCAAQNKNWAFMSFLVYIVNCSKVAAQSVEVYYFEPGHTFMSADSLHHQIELSLKHQKKTCDFDDFVRAVQQSNHGKITTKAMDITDFYNFQDYSSVYKRNSNQNEKVHLSNIVHVKAVRESFELEYKTDMTSIDSKKLNFLKSDLLRKKKFPEPVRHTIPCGVSAEKKKSINDNLLELMEDNRRVFWLNLPVE